jgi:septum formation protein
MDNPPSSFILASTSPTRARLLQAAGLNPQIIPPRVDEEQITLSLLAEAATPRDIADTLAEAKARKISAQMPQRLVLGCDQTLDLKGNLIQKVATPHQAIEQLTQMQGQTHHLYSAAVLYENAQPIWRHIGHARMTMRSLSPHYIESYVHHHWPSIGQAVGCYKIEEVGVQLFSEIQGDTFTIQGLPLIPLLNFLANKGVIAI